VNARDATQRNSLAGVESCLGEGALHHHSASLSARQSPSPTRASLRDLIDRQAGIPQTGPAGRVACVTNKKRWEVQSLRLNAPSQNMATHFAAFNANEELTQQHFR